MNKKLIALTFLSFSSLNASQGSWGWSRISGIASSIGRTARQLADRTARATQAVAQQAPVTPPRAPQTLRSYQSPVSPSIVRTPLPEYTDPATPVVASLFTSPLHFSDNQLADALSLNLQPHTSPYGSATWRTTNQELADCVQRLFTDQPQEQPTSTTGIEGVAQHTQPEPNIIETPTLLAPTDEPTVLTETHPVTSTTDLATLASEELQSLTNQPGPCTNPSETAPENVAEHSQTTSETLAPAVTSTPESAPFITILQNESQPAAVPSPLVTTIEQPTNAANTQPETHQTQQTIVAAPAPSAAEAAQSQPQAVSTNASPTRTYAQAAATAVSIATAVRRPQTAARVVRQAVRSARNVPASVPGRAVPQIQNTVRSTVQNNPNIPRRAAAPHPQFSTQPAAPLGSIAPTLPPQPRMPRTPAPSETAHTPVPHSRQNFLLTQLQPRPTANRTSIRSISTAQPNNSVRQAPQEPSLLSTPLRQQEGLPLLEVSPSGNTLDYGTLTQTAPNNAQQTISSYSPIPEPTSTVTTYAPIPDPEILMNDYDSVDTIQTAPPLPIETPPQPPVPGPRIYPRSTSQPASNQVQHPAPAPQPAPRNLSTTASDSSSSTSTSTATTTGGRPVPAPRTPRLAPIPAPRRPLVIVPPPSAPVRPVARPRRFPIPPYVFPSWPVTWPAPKPTPVSDTETDFDDEKSPIKTIEKELPEDLSPAATTPYKTITRSKEQPTGIKKEIPARPLPQENSPAPSKRSSKEVLPYELMLQKGVSRVVIDKGRDNAVSKPAPTKIAQKETPEVPIRTIRSGINKNNTPLSDQQQKETVAQPALPTAQKVTLPEKRVVKPAPSTAIHKKITTHQTKPAPVGPASSLKEDLSPAKPSRPSFMDRVKSVTNKAIQTVQSFFKSF